MKILVVQDRLRSGGTERQSVFLANAFTAAGHEATLLTFRPGGQLDSTVAPAVHRQALQPFETGLDWFAPGLTRWARQTTPEVILCMGRMANCYAGALQRAVPAAAVVSTMRTGKNLPALFRRSLRVTRHVVANSHEACATLVEQHGVPVERISVIYNSLVFQGPPVARAGSVHVGTSAPGSTKPPRETEAAGDPSAALPHGRSPSAAALRSQYGAADAAPVLLCVAMFRPEKNQRELIEVCAHLPSRFGWQLWLAGDGPARAECERLAAARNLAAWVKFVGFQRDPSALYGAADIAVHASWSESLSNFLIEAQANGLPAVAYEAQGIRECFVPDRTGWAIRRDDREAFRAALQRLFTESPEARIARASEARAFARATFDPERQVQAYLELFAQLTRR